MKKNKLIFTTIGILALVVGAVFYLLGGTQEPQAVVSDDGKATLFVPNGALPEGVALKDIKITKLTDDGFSGFDVVYQLEPDGLEFERPVTVKATMPIPDNVPIAFLASGDSVEILSDSEISVQNDVATVIVRLQHFSFLGFAEGPFTIRIEPDKINSNVDKTFYISITPRIVKLGDIILTPPAITGEVISSITGEAISSIILEKIKYNFWGPARVYGKWTHRGGILEPESRGLQEKMNWGEFRPALPRDFTCVKAGKDTLIYDGKISSQATTKILKNGKWVEPKQTYVTLTQKYHVPVNCLAQEETPVGTINSGEEPEEKMTSVEMLVLDGQYFPKHQFRIADPDVCRKAHYHADGVVYGLKSRDALDIVSRGDPNPGSCGFGTEPDTPVETIQITEEQSLELLKYLLE